MQVRTPTKALEGRQQAVWMVCYRPFRASGLVGFLPWGSRPRLYAAGPSGLERGLEETRQLRCRNQGNVLRTPPVDDDDLTVLRHLVTARLARALA